ncbi:MAG: tol-pal system protein YbgF [Acidobacteria bacterium]|nr:tol-pal system protein YbgF [Acidobacteriota bacterium]MBI3662022.1 tol-pal system protein YbgF [Acidobacteriota bacterium]
MRKRYGSLTAVGVAVALALLAPAPAAAQKKEIIQLQADMERLMQTQRELQRTVDEKNAVLKTLVEQSLDAVNKLNTTLGVLQKSIQDVQANSGARIDTLTTQVQALADNLEEVKSRLGKLNQQMGEAQSVLQSLDAKIAGGAPAQPPGGAATPPPSADALYSNALRDFTGGKYDLARQQFLDYLKFFPENDFASNAQFYLGEILYAQKQYPEAIAEYDKVLDNYPKSFKLGAARLKKGMALLEMGQKASALRELREVVRRHPATEEERRARAKLRELGAAAPAPTRQQ